MSPGIHGYHEVAIVVSNLERSERFYRDVLGMQVLMRIANRNVTMIIDQDQNQFLGLWLPDTHGSAAGREYGKIHAVLAIDVADIDAWYEQLKAHGVNVVKRVKDNGDVHLDFDDPDGHPLELWGRTGSRLAVMPGAEVPPESRHLFFNAQQADGR